MPNPGWGNRGIIAHTVSADVMAVGEGARATKTVHAENTEALRARAKALWTAVDALKLPLPQRNALEEDVTGLSEAAGPKPDSDKARTHLRSICDKLKMVGIAVRDVAALAEPVRDIANLLQIPLHFVGLG
jgi:hypothetical protein